MCGTFVHDLEYLEKKSWSQVVRQYGSNCFYFNAYTLSENK